MPTSLSLFVFCAVISRNRRDAGRWTRTPIERTSLQLTLQGRETTDRNPRTTSAPTWQRHRNRSWCYRIGPHAIQTSQVYLHKRALSLGKSHCSAHSDFFLPQCSADVAKLHMPLRKLGIGTYVAASPNASTMNSAENVKERNEENPYYSGDLNQHAYIYRWWWNQLETSGK